jgi:acetyl esterase/lipase
MQQWKPRKGAGGSRLRRRALALAAVALVLTGMSATPSLADDGDETSPAEVFTDIAYTEPDPADTVGNLLDIYLPDRPDGDVVPLVIFTEGSAWFADNGKVSGAAWAAELNPHGYAVAGVSVRSSAQTRFPGQLHDIKAAIRFLRSHADEYGIDPDRIAIAGFSSGGWTAAIAGVTGDAADPELEGTTGVTGVSSRVQAVVTLSPPTAFKLMDAQATEFSVLVHGVPDSPEALVTGCAGYPTGPLDEACTAAELANPVQYVSSDDPPFLMFHGDEDPLLPPGQSQVLFDALAAACVDATFHLVGGEDHNYDYLADPDRVAGQTVTALDTESCEPRSVAASKAGAASYATIVAFLDRVLGPDEAEAAGFDVGLLLAVGIPALLVVVAVIVVVLIRRRAAAASAQG